MRRRLIAFLGESIAAWLAIVTLLLGWIPTLTGMSLELF